MSKHPKKKPVKKPVKKPERPKRPEKLERPEKLGESKKPLITLLVTGVVLVLLILILTLKPFRPNKEEIVLQPQVQSETPVAEPTPTPAPTPADFFRSVTLESKNPKDELIKMVGADNVSTVLAINRTDDKHFTKGMVITVPKTFDDPLKWEFMPQTINAASSIPKLILISQGTQAFGFYENGKLVRSGPVSSGKQSTPTSNGLYFTNWKGKRVISSVNDKWILNWNFNIQNNKGISIHQYSLPGFPASHSCVRMSAADAKWLFDWADQWILTANGRTELAHGTPVILFGKYDYKNKAPWKQLPTNTLAVHVEQKVVEDIVVNNLVTIQKEQMKREEVLKNLK